jgi:uncharacterized protein (TIGR02145 family)
LVFFILGVGALPAGALPTEVLPNSDAAPQWVPGEPLLDRRDGQTYRTVVIGEQLWMAENLNIGTMIESDRQGSQMSDNGITEKYCWENDEAHCTGAGGVMKRGGFYEWEEAVQHWRGQPWPPTQGVCPDGWHVPSMQEWNKMLGLLGGDQAYKELIVGGSSGFDALMTGYRCTMTGGFRPSAMSPDYRAYFWSADQEDERNAPLFEVSTSSLVQFPFRKSLGLSVRCVWDEKPGAAPTVTPTRQATEEPTVEPTGTPGATDTATPEATEEPTLAPTETVTGAPTETVTTAPTETVPATPTEVSSHTAFLPLLKRE